VGYLSTPIPEARYLQWEALLGVLFHDVNGAAGVGVLGSTIISDLTQELKTKISSGTLKSSDLEQSLDEILEASRSIETTMSNLPLAIELAKKTLFELSTTGTETRTFGEIWNQVLHRFDEELTEKNLSVETILEPSAKVGIRQGILEVILFELLRNTLTYGFSNKTVVNLTIEAKINQENPTFELVWYDNGSGAELKKVKSHTAKVRFDQGLGLPLVHRLVTRYLQGKMRIRTAPDQGFRVEIDIPMSS